ncbi:hypothetical protein [Chitinophaga sancti]|uniref:Uncharacterized protein n=1 Tax=Chitinophaga sancti TaxID=1004 RepID=A0A1K1LUR0_9BACT|nr:hypothetical protein [Chitinophaga sancti]WQD64832.1 hypothetical protein U0033_10535 [Chitinophaga sancti]WQG89544.1 hypothetical protein SR876_31935 [Chitinophaga sancti]SFW14661.1 hypothetical protein SAMN05661012_00233 [Chitinophaga sancti]
MRKHLILSGILVVMSAFSLYAQSGKPKAAPAKKPAAASGPTITKLRFRSTWGIFLSDSIPRSEIAKLLDSALVVRDEKNNKYPVVSFEFTYENKEFYLNDTTGKPGIYTEYVGDSFKGDKLPALWVTRIKELLDKGEVFYFDNIIVNYTGDKLYRAPKLKFIVR